MSMQQQAADLRTEGDELNGLLETLDDGDWARPTPFKNWTVNDVMTHLHQGDWMQVLTIKDGDAYLAAAASRRAARERNDGTSGLEEHGFEAGQGPALREQWYAYFREMCDLMAASDPKRRVKWGGPDMSIRMAATARQMETWAHGQDVYDMLRRPRTPTDRLENIAVLGVKTYGWTFANRGLEVPGPQPYVRLVAPSGAIWDWGDPDEANSVEGSALEFCQVVTQGRNIADVNLTVAGEPAEAWMAIAQCFAGPVNDPPKPGQRAWG
jgi:uncharacterized protein (TIGR03084 family)